MFIKFLKNFWQYTIYTHDLNVKVKTLSFSVISKAVLSQKERFYVAPQKNLKTRKAIVDKASETILMLLAVIASISAIIWFGGWLLVKEQNVTKKSACSD